MSLTGQRRIWALPLGVLLLLAACNDAPGPPPPAPPPPIWRPGQVLIGTWTDGNELLVFDAQGGRIASPCSETFIRGPVYLDTCATFDALGRIEAGTGAATLTPYYPAGRPTPLPGPLKSVRFRGWVDADRLFLVIGVDTNYVMGEDTNYRTAEPVLYHFVSPAHPYVPPPP
ncbi:MAG TPA: hypothetical protein VKY74_18885, partial [Chloroflexia bacterium]|nr:hypothetical protein [Chloroflexia bacterium]